MKNLPDQSGFNDPDLTGSIPSPEIVRARLDQNRREARFLKSLLKLSREVKDARGQSAPVMDSGGRP
ncbi:MAG: hypothetical protein M3552_03170 [Planctomycetota bacterium]|nr:hypothetical protein [Planctomycetota bacterium]